MTQRLAYRKIVDRAHGIISCVSIQHLEKPYEVSYYKRTGVAYTDAFEMQTKPWLQSVFVQARVMSPSFEFEARYIPAKLPTSFHHPTSLRSPFWPLWDPCSCSPTCVLVEQCRLMGVKFNVFLCSIFGLYKA